MIRLGYLEDIGWESTTQQNYVPGSQNFSTVPITTTTQSSETSSFWNGTNFMGILNTIGATIPQVIQAKNGQQVIVQDSSGATKDISAELIAKLEAEANSANTSSNEILEVLKASLSNQTQAVATNDKTPMYIAAGVGGLILLGGIIYIASSKK